MPKVMRVVLNRGNDHFEELVRSVMVDIFGEAATLTIADHAISPETADLVIWNYQPGDQPPLSANDFSSHPLTLFVADEQALSELQPALDGPAANIIFRPVQPDTLAAFLRAVSSAQRSGGVLPASPIDSMRSQRDELLRALMQANVRLQEYDRDQTNFLTRAVNDFRAPISALTGYCGLLMSGQLGPVSEQQRNVLVRMRQSAIRLSDLAEGMVDVSAGLHTDREPALKEADFRQFIQWAIDKARPLIEDKSIDVSVDLVPPAGPLLVDPSKLEQVCATLVDNACRFTPRGGYLEIAGYSFRTEHWAHPGASTRRILQTESPNCYRIDFRDTGPEIKTSLFSDVFEEHRSCSEGYDRSGAGLGLPTCRMIIAQHGGHIWAENSESGAVFSFVLPFAAGHALRAASQVAYA